ncbi:MAG TPA: hypothetical protein VFV12_13330, partial [Xanthobacteraceae bacterium]|nr:hypothetical protein [Xanthobacteraceae bacterium]
MIALPGVPTLTDLNGLMTMARSDARRVDDRLARSVLSHKTNQAFGEDENAHCSFAFARDGVDADRFH